jgi:uncharacterized protein DUF4424
MRRRLAALLLTVCVATSALANDSTSMLATGGLVLVKTDDIEMRSEDLFISEEKIRVVYRFFNKSAKDVTTIVAFPMPDLNFSDSFDVAIPNPGSQNFLDFQTIVNGRPVTADIEQKAFAPDGTQHTELLRKLGVPLGGAGMEEALRRLPRERWDELVRSGLAEIEEDGLGKGTKQLSPRWTLRTKYFWQQTFPAGSELVVEHRYRPSVGGTVQTPFGDPEEAKEEHIYPRLLKAYCVDQDLLAALDRARRAPGAQGRPPYSQSTIHYILTTGANWAGPIQDFRLVVDKGNPSYLVSFCGEGVKKIGPTQFEMRKTNFTPNADLRVLILKKNR